MLGVSLFALHETRRSLAQDVLYQQTPTAEVAVYRFRKLGAGEEVADNAGPWPHA